MSPLNFDTWMRNLDEICYSQLGVSYQDLPDQPFKDWYNDGLTPEDAFFEMAETSYPGAEFSNVYYQEFDEYTDADPGL